MSLAQVQKKFLTEKFRIFYPVTPILSLSLAAGLASLGLYGILPVSWAFSFAMGILTDNLIMNPFLRWNQSVGNLANKRKQVKSKITMAAIISGLIVLFLDISF